MSEIPAIKNSAAATSAGYRRFRHFFVFFSLVLACAAAWILFAELSSPAPLAFPTNPDASPDPALNRTAAHRAAMLGMVRGDLWAQDALTYSDIFRHENRNGADAKNTATLEEARYATERALALAPYDARLWLMLAALRARVDRAKASSAILMSYYTGRNEPALMPVRLSLALNSPSITDKEFQELVTHDLSLIVSRHPELKPAILTAYQNASPEGQQFVRDALKGLDPDFLAKLPQKQ